MKMRQSKTTRCIARTTGMHNGQYSINRVLLYLSELDGVLGRKKKKGLPLAAVMVTAQGSRQIGPSVQIHGPVLDRLGIRATGFHGSASGPWSRKISIGDGLSGRFRFTGDDVLLGWLWHSPWIR